MLDAGPRARKAPLAVLLATLALAACTAEPPPLLTGVDVSGAAGLFGVTNPGPAVTWYQVMTDGSVRPAATQGSRVIVQFPGSTLELDLAYPHRIEQVSTELAVVVMGPVDFSDPRAHYASKVMTLDLVTGRMDDAWPGADNSIGRCMVLAPAEVPQRFVQPAPDGSLAVLPLDPYHLEPSSAVQRAAWDGVAWTYSWPLTPVGRATSWFALDAAGNLAIDDLVVGGPPTFIPAVGPMVESPVTGTLGSYWAAHGALYTTRARGDLAGTVELIRFDFPPGGGVSALATTSWTGTGVLTGWPLAMGSATVFMSGSQPVVFDSLDAPPAVHAPLGLTWTRLQATANALWFTTTGPSSSSMTRWMRDGVTATLPADGWSYDELFPVSDHDVLIGATRRADGAGAILRSDGATMPAAVELGPSPHLHGHLRWR